MPEIVFISGCSSGIGLATAKLLAHDPLKRFVVYVTILRPLTEEKRFQEAAGSALNDTLFPIQMDVTVPEMVRKAVARVVEKHKRIDILINIAGVNCVNVTEAISSEVMRRVFDINFFGTVRVTQEVLPIMKKQGSGRIINMGSVHGVVAFPYMAIYGATKQAIIGFSQEIATVGRFFNIHVSVIEPGSVSTDIMSNMKAQRLGGHQQILNNPEINDVDMALSSCYDRKDIFHNELLNASHTQQPGDIADLILKVATDEKPHFRYQTSKIIRAVAERFYKDITGDSFIEYQYQELKAFRERLREENSNLSDEMV